jgi:hypothetical protein
MSCARSTTLAELVVSLVVSLVRTSAVIENGGERAENEGRKEEGKGRKEQGEERFLFQDSICRTVENNSLARCLYKTLA